MGNINAYYIGQAFLEHFNMLKKNHIGYIFLLLKK